MSTPNAGEDEKQQALSLDTGGNAKQCSRLEDSLSGFYKAQPSLTICPTITLPGFYPNELKTYVHMKKACTEMLIMALFIIIQIGGKGSSGMGVK